MASDIPASLPAVTPILIESEESGVRLDFGELWSHRELLYFLVWRDIKVRYKQTAMGAAWAILQPLASMLLFTAVFNRLGGFNSPSVPYPLFAYSGLLLWTFFAGGVVNSTNSLIGNTNLITKVYFPRMFIPAAAVAAGLLDLGIASVILVILALYYRVPITWSFALLPLFVALATLLAFGVGMFISATTVRYRDVRHALPFIIQFWMFASPVVYPVSAVSGRLRWVLLANPLSGILEGFRASLVGSRVDWSMTGLDALETLLILAASTYIFRRAEDSFADVI